MGVCTSNFDPRVNQFLIAEYIFALRIICKQKYLLKERRVSSFSVLSCRLETSVCVAAKPSETKLEREEQEVKETEKKRHRKHRGRKRHSRRRCHRSALETSLIIMISADVDFFYWTILHRVCVSRCCCEHKRGVLF